jgi:hypothetical protein
MGAPVMSAVRRKATGSVVRLNAGHVRKSSAQPQQRAVMVNYGIWTGLGGEVHARMLSCCHARGKTGQSASKLARTARSNTPVTAHAVPSDPLFETSRARSRQPVSVAARVPASQCQAPLRCTLPTVSALQTAAPTDTAIALGAIDSRPPAG